jgi:hypothetical protein
MGDTIPNFDDLSYTGLTDTGTGFSGSSTYQDVQLGSPIVLDTAYGPNSASVTDALNSVPTITSNVTSSGGLTENAPVETISSSDSVGNTITAQQLSGASDVPPGAIAGASTPTPNSSAPNQVTIAGLSALSKLGAAFATLFGQPAITHAGAAPNVQTPAGAVATASTPGIAVSGTNTIILLIVVGALIALLAVGKEA